jgi:hypothetical protein
LRGERAPRGSPNQLVEVRERVLDRQDLRLLALINARKGLQRQRLVASILHAR